CAHKRQNSTPVSSHWKPAWIHGRANSSVSATDQYWNISGPFASANPGIMSTASKSLAAHMPVAPFGNLAKGTGEKDCRNGRWDISPSSGVNWDFPYHAATSIVMSTTPAASGRDQTRNM